MDEKATRRDVADDSCAPLPATRAFVVQLRAPADPAGDVFVGRAEHMASGTAEQFSCAAELVAFITKMLATPREVP